MPRPQLEHIIRAAAGITNATQIVVIGSLAVLEQFPNAPADLLVSNFILLKSRAGVAESC